jgi:DNA polymerase-3 subunit epsilon
MLAEPIQTTLDESEPLTQVTFCVVDLETTGGSPRDNQITEIGAVKYRGGDRLGVFQSLVNPLQPIPPRVAHLTGIDDSLVAGEPAIHQVLPAFVEFAHGCVIVAHNAPFDFTFLNHNLERLDYPLLPGPPVCTARLARRLVWPDVPNVKLRTLAEYFRTRTKPVHRALADAEACAEVLHSLLALGGRLGILSIGDLHEVVRARGRPNFGKIGLADALPHAPGVYLFRGRQGQVLYVGKSNDLRARVKSYFYGDGRKKVENLLSEVTAVEGLRCSGELEALILETRLIRRHEPKYNRRGKTWRKAAYLKLDPAEAFPRFKVVRAAKRGDDCTYIGPFGTAARAKLVKEAIESSLPIRRCSTPMNASTRFAPCALADMGRCLAPCDGRTGLERYAELVRGLISSLTASPGELLETLEAQMNDLASQERYEQAALVRDRLHALATALHHARSDAWLIAAGRVVIEHADGTRSTFEGGSLVRDGDLTGPEPLWLPCPRERADELAVARSWLARSPGRLLETERSLAEPVQGGATIARILARTRTGHAGQGARSSGD